MYRRTSLPFRILFKTLAWLRSAKFPETLSANTEDFYITNHTRMYFHKQWWYGYHRVFDLVRNLDVGADTGSLHVLSLGPRTEIELYYLWLFWGFSWEKIVGADLMAPTSKIKLADMSVKLPFEDNSFDLIVASHCLEKSRNQERTRDEIRRVVKMGGRVLVGGDRPPSGTTVQNKWGAMVQCFDNGVYGLISLYNLSLQDIEYMNARSPHGYEIIFKVRK